MMQDLLLCTDLDRTLLPNGVETESTLARPLFARLCEGGDLCLAYVSGRSLALLQQAVSEYAIPVPHYAIGDVGSTIYKIEGNVWRSWDAWQDQIAPDWNGYKQGDLSQLLHDIDSIQLQESEKQNDFKLSYYTDMAIDTGPLLTRITERLKARDVFASLIWSVDEEAGVGLLDILPQSATKLGAIHFLMHQVGFTQQTTVFAGDSGNDLPVLCSDLNSILVLNAHDDVRAEVLATMDYQCSPVYQARGDFLGMNGNYAAGILEGLVHYQPQLKNRLEKMAASM